MKRSIFLPDNYTLMLVGALILGSLLPVSGWAATGMDGLTTAAIILLFFLHGARLPREAIVAGLMHWRLHLCVFVCTFVAFPLLGLLARPVLSPLISDYLYIGILFLCMLPSTVQSSIALTSIARGNVPAALCAASASTLLGVVLTPFLVDWLVVPTDGAGSSLESVGRIMLQLMLPFVLGHLLREKLGAAIRNRQLVMLVDRGSILLIVYTAFSAASLEGLWRHVSGGELLTLLLICALMLACIMGFSSLLGRIMGFSMADRITLTFCGSKKSLASGVPIAHILFSASMVGAMVLPLMLFHQLQLIVCSILAQRWSQRPPDTDQADQQAKPTKA